MNEHGTRYRCRDCGRHKIVPERPLNPEPKIRTGCKNCNRITVQSPVGSIHTQ